MLEYPEAVTLGRVLYARTRPTRWVGFDISRSRHPSPRFVSRPSRPLICLSTTYIRKL